MCQLKFFGTYGLYFRFLEVTFFVILLRNGVRSKVQEVSMLADNINDNENSHRWTQVYDCGRGSG